ncbi:MAG: hypothetical protein ACREON_03800 [Gemmatimonadaceae bacterium]
MTASNATSVGAALQTALAKPAVRTAVKAEVSRQLRVNRPIAVVNGYWVSAVNLGSLYQVPAVRTELLSALGPNGPQLIGGATVDPDRIGIAFTPQQLADLMLGDLMRDVTASLAGEALALARTDVFGVDDAIIVALAVGVVVGLVSAEVLHHHSGVGDSPAPPTVDTSAGDNDGDGVKDYMDDDDDNDGTVDAEDSYPYDSSKSICACGRGRGIALTKAARGDLLPALISTLNAARAAQAKRVTLGPVVSGQTASLTFVF